VDELFFGVARAAARQQRSRSAAAGNPHPAGPPVSLKGAIGGGPKKSKPCC
jgi:hypothetical protein